MKNFICFFAIASVITVIGCNQNKKPVAKLGISGLKTGKHCYTAIFEKDSANLMVDIGADGRVSGKLSVKYFNPDTVSKKRQSTNGAFGGAFRGDTLFADYSFTSGKNKDAKYFNPIALLHKGDTLIMGHGIMYYYLGRTYFDPQTPIIYDNSRFRFLPVNCK